MAARFVMTRILLVCLLSEVNYSLAFPRGASFLHPKSWQSGGGESQELLGYGNRRLIQSVESLRVSPRSWRPNIPHDQVNAEGQSTPVRFLGAPRSARIQNQQLSDVGSRWQQAMSPHIQPRGFDISLEIPVKESHKAFLHEPTDFKVQSSFNMPGRPGRKSEQNLFKPSFEFGLSLPISRDLPKNSDSAILLNYRVEPPKQTPVKFLVEQSAAVSPVKQVVKDLIKEKQQAIKYFPPTVPKQTQPVQDPVVKKLSYGKQVSPPQMQQYPQYGYLPSDYYEYRSPPVDQNYGQSQMGSSGTGQMYSYPWSDYFQKLISPYFTSRPAKEMHPTVYW
ncbi:uncharacterized protein LOC125015104 [Mugil cephalus]|uniref:uncharacterized protein LOC125015104 n=1 Tax=Mugil cephalus TaxID=48193 RepID=UPI001FB74CAD|nr:uncharacterized protein LOC125015104 [Mugil cephalus]